MEGDQWTHLAYRGDGMTFEILVDGEADMGPSAPYNGTLDLHNTLFIGKQGSTESWGGRIDDFRVYRRALSDEEIGRIMSEDPGKGPRFSFLRGDCNGDAKVSGQVTDAVFMLNFNFLGGPPPARPPATPTAMAASRGRSPTPSTSSTSISWGAGRPRRRFRAAARRRCPRTRRWAAPPRRQTAHRPAPPR
jgi:hypothetical protein